MVYILLI